MNQKEKNYPELNKKHNLNKKQSLSLELPENTRYV